MSSNNIVPNKRTRKSVFTVIMNQTSACGMGVAGNVAEVYENKQATDLVAAAHPE